jgi:ATP-binding cassette subfamily G (WHITE) protein 2 (SNQ2)
MSKYDDQPTPDLSGLPGAYPQTPGQTPAQTPAQSSLAASRQQSYQFVPPTTQQSPESAFGTQSREPFTGTAAQQRSSSRTPSNAQPADIAGVGVVAGVGAASFAQEEPIRTNISRDERPLSDASTVVPSPVDESGHAAPIEAKPPFERVETTSSFGEEAQSGFAPLKVAPLGLAEKEERPELGARTSSRKVVTENELAHVLSRRRTQQSRSLSRVATERADPDQLAEEEEINKLMSRMFGKTRQANSEDEKTRHVGVVWKNLTVKGMGLGAALQPTTGDIFLGLPRFIKNLFSKGPKKAAGKPPVRTIINDFNGCIKPGEMLLVLGRPGAGCSTFLKCLGNQRFGYESVEGDVTYGGTDAATMGKNYRGEVLYNPEDDLHYATLSVKQTLRFALKTRTPDKASRNEGESRDDYIAEFLRVVSKLFWIEHTMGTKVGNAFVRGVSGGEKKRVSIAEAMITKASTQAWDNRYEPISLNPVAKKENLLSFKYTRSRC